MRVSFLNLDRSADRLASFMTSNAHLSDLHRIPAIDGKAYSRQDLQAAGIIAGNLPAYTDGALGCALSHLCQWELACQTNQSITVAEDDAIFHRHFERLAPGILSSLPPDWDIIQWAWNFDSILAFDLMPGVSNCVGVFNQTALRKGVSRFQELSINPQAYRLQRSFGTACQSLSPAGAAKLLRHCRPIRPMDTSYPLLSAPLPNSGIDNMMNQLYPQINAYVCVPPLVITTNNRATSTIQPMRSAVRSDGIVLPERTNREHLPLQ